MILNKKTKWSIDHTHSSIHFKVKHLMIAHVRGSFKKFDASIYLTNNDFTTAEIDFWIDVASIDTGNANRDTHLCSADFFDVAKYPQISFISNNIGRQTENGVHELWGTLTIKGIAKVVKLIVEFGGVINDLQGNEKSGFLVDGKVNRSDWGIIFNSPLTDEGVMIGEAVTISCEMELLNEKSDDLKRELDFETRTNHVSKTGKSDIFY